MWALHPQMYPTMDQKYKEGKNPESPKKKVEFVAFPGGSVVKNPLAHTGDADSIPVLGRSPGEGNGNPLQYSCLKNSINRGAWWAMGSMRLQKFQTQL